jgi:hypothetical protein
VLFLFKRKTIHLDCFTKHPYVYDYAPIRHASHFIPEWWRQLPKDVGRDGLHDKLNMKACAGFVDLYKVGVMLPMWSDLRIAMTPNGNVAYQYSDTKSSAGFHHPDQRGDFASEDQYINLKLTSPWLFRSKEDISWIMIPAMYANNDPGRYITCIGALNFKHQSGSNVNLLLPKKDVETTIEIQHGEPIAHVVPMSDKKVKVHNHLVDETEFERLSADWAQISFSRSYWKRKRIKEKHNG